MAKQIVDAENIFTARFIVQEKYNLTLVHKRTALANDIQVLPSAKDLVSNLAKRR